MTAQLSPVVVGVIAGVLMILASLDRKQLNVRAQRCPVCHQRGRRCTCRWRRWEV